MCSLIGKEFTNLLRTIVSTSGHELMAQALEEFFISGPHRSVLQKFADASKREGWKMNDRASQMFLTEDQAAVKTRPIS
jgi:hypothetical protein